MTMLRGTRSSNVAASTMGCNARSRCLGFISLRTATLMLAMIGVVGHLQMFRNLAVLHDSFPHVPKLRHLAQSNIPVTAMTTKLTTTEPIVHEQASQGAEYPLVETQSDVRSLRYSSWSASLSSSQSSLASKANLPTTTTSLTRTTPVRQQTSTQTLSEHDRLAIVKPTRWFNLLPKRPWGEGHQPTAEEAATWRAQQADQDEERKSWETARKLTQIMRIYALLSALACALGVYGVSKGNLASTRIFVMSSFLDVFLFAFSVVSMCVVITYPEIRSMLCEQISSGELHSILAYIHGGGATDDNGASTPVLSPVATAMLDAGAADDLAISTQVVAAHSASHASPTLPAARFLSYATGPFWKRALAGQRGASSSIVHMYWWDTLVDDMLENESCDDIFVSVLVPLGLMVCLTYLAFRIHFLFVIRSHYTNLLRQRASYYLGSSGISSLTSTSSSSSSSSSSSGSNGRGRNKIRSNSSGNRSGSGSTLGAICEKPFRKDSSSSSSSSTVIDFRQTRGGVYNEKWASEKVALGEKMA